MLRPKNHNECDAFAIESSPRCPIDAVELLYSSWLRCKNTNTLMHFWRETATERRKYNVKKTNEWMKEIAKVQTVWNDEMKQLKLHIEPTRRFWYASILFFFFWSSLLHRKFTCKYQQRANSSKSLIGMRCIYGLHCNHFMMPNLTKRHSPRKKEIDGAIATA